MTKRNEMQEKKFIEHLDELRTCLLRASAGLLIGTAASFIFISSIFKFISKPYLDILSKSGMSVNVAFRSLSPADTLQVTLKAAIMCGLCITFPWIVYQIWRFVSPALYKKEKKYSLIFCSSTIILFACGAAFCYYAVLPTTLSFFHNYSLGFGVTPEWTIGNYYSFVVTFILGFGLVFELPVAITILSFLGLVTPKTLVTYRRHAIICIFIVAAFFTPSPDFVSQLMMGVPMVLLYEISIFAARLIQPRVTAQNFE